MNYKTKKEGRELIKKLALTIAKAKSNAIESGNWDVMCIVDPQLERSAELILDLDLMLPPDECGMLDAYNALILMGRHEMFEIMWKMRWNLGDLPEAQDWIVDPK